MLLFFISTFRAENIGADYPEYIRIFHRIEVTGTAYCEKGYVFLNKIALLFGNKTYILSCTINLIIFPCVYYFIKKHVEKKYWIYAVFVFVANPYLYIQSTFNALRQGTAMALALLAFSFFLENKKLYSILVFVIAINMHRSIIVQLIIMLLLKVKWNKKIFRNLSIICLGINMLKLNRLVPWLMQLFRYGSYGNYESSLFNNPIYVLFVFAVLQLIIEYYDKIVNECKRKQFVDLFIFSLCFLMIAVTNDMVYRVYICLALISIPGAFEIIEHIKKYKYGNIIRYCYVFYYLFYYLGYIYLFYKNHNSSYVPFKLIF